MRLLKFLPLAGVAIFAFILSGLDLQKISGILMKTNVLVYVISMLCLAPVLVLRGYKWNILVRSCGKNYPLKRATTVFLISNFVGLITPGKIGDFLRSFYLSREKEMPFGKSLATVFVDRAIDVVLLVLLTFIGIFGLLYFYGLKEASLAFIFIGSAGIIAAMLAVFSKRLIKKLLTPLYKVMIPERFRDRLRDSFHDFYEGTKEIRKNRKGLAASFLFTLLLWLGNIIVFYIVGLSAGIPLNFMFFAFIMPIAFLAESLPISISGVGTREAVFVLLYPLASLSQEQAVAHAILILLHNLLIGSVGLLLWLRNRINLS